MLPGSLPAPSSVLFGLWRVMTSLWRSLTSGAFSTCLIFCTSVSVSEALQVFVSADLWHYVAAFVDSLSSWLPVPTLFFASVILIFLKLVPVSLLAGWRPLDLQTLPYFAWKKLLVLLVLGVSEHCGVNLGHGPSAFFSPGIGPVWCIALSFATALSFAFYSGFCRSWDLVAFAELAEKASWARYLSELCNKCSILTCNMQVYTVFTCSYGNVFHIRWWKYVS